MEMERKKGERERGGERERERERENACIGKGICFIYKLKNRNSHVYVMCEKIQLESTRNNSISFDFKSI